MSVATLHKVFLSKVRRSVCFDLRESSRGESMFGIEQGHTISGDLMCGRGQEKISKCTYPQDA